MAVAVALPVAFALAGVDYLSARNSLAVTVPLLIAVGAGYAAGSRTGRIAMAGVVALSIGIVIAGAGQPKFHSEDWRSAAEDLGRSSHWRAVVATPGQAGRKPLEYYLGAARLGWTRSVRVVEVDIVVMPPQGESRVARRELVRLLRDEGMLEFRRGRGVTVAGTPEKGAVIARARELVRFARQQGYRRDELIRLMEDIA